jgi:torulene dioxygenase
MRYVLWLTITQFDATYEERKPFELQVEGSIPPYAAGTLFRTGSGPRTVQTLNGKEFKVNHWFDNFSQGTASRYTLPKQVRLSG